MTINLFDQGGCPLERQRFTWKEPVGNAHPRPGRGALPPAAPGAREARADDFGEALKQENGHLAVVRGWLRTAVLQEAA